MNKVPCGGFELGESLIMKDNKLDLAEGAGSLPTGGAPYDQLCIGNDGLAKWATITLPVMFVVTDATSSATIQCNFEYEELMWRLETFNFGIMNGQLYIESTKSLFTMVGCTQKNTWLEFSFVAPMDASDGLVLGKILKVYYRQNGAITFDAPVE